ncbi:MAG: polysaccharide export protein [Desulfobacteraceae bacterium]|nr:MAG: polysaccharide export protein [Desulfobacteraceae bacterium]
MSEHLLGKVLIIVLVFQMILGAGATVWSQTGGRGQLGAAQGKAGEMGSPSTPGKGAAGIDGVQSAETATESLPGGQALSKAVVPEKYILGPGDGLSVNIWGDYKESQDVKVTPDGKIVLPSIGDLYVSGLTLSEAEMLIVTEAKSYYRTVYASVSLISLRVFQVLVLGEVPKPGMYLGTPVRRVSELIEKAGGVLTSGSRRHIQLRREGKVQAYADLYTFLHRGDESLNPYVRDGDVIFVPTMGESRVVAYVSQVSGTGGLLKEDAFPYTVEIKEGEKLSAVIDQLGGVSPWWDLERVLIQRESETPEGTMRIPVDLRDYLLKKEEAGNPIMLPGDQVYIPALIRRVFVGGSVSIPGAYVYVPGRPAESYIGQAGGVLITGDLGRSYIQRANGTVEPYAGMMELNDGDSIIVMEKLFKTWQDYFTLVGAISGVIVGLVGFYAVFTNFGR